MKPTPQQRAVMMADLPFFAAPQAKCPEPLNLSAPEPVGAAPIPQHMQAHAVKMQAPASAPAAAKRRGRPPKVKQ